ncbi:MAG: hypothetical protein RL329_1943 [Bacteroidota bacterium]
MKSTFSLEKLLYALFAAYLIAIPSNAFLNLPHLGDKLQLPEILFLLISIVFGAYFGFSKTIQELKNWHFTAIDKGILAFCAAVCCSCLVHCTRASILEMIGLGYLMTFYLMMRLFFQNTPYNILDFTTRFFLISGFIVAVVGLVGWFMATFLHIETLTARLYINYPYLGDVYRVFAFTSHPVMLASFMGVCLLVLGIKSRMNPKNLSHFEWIAFSCMSMVEILTFTKSIVALSACFLWLIDSFFYKNHRLVPKIITVSVAMILIFFVFMTHFIVIDTTKYDALPLEKRHFYHRSEAIPYVKIGNIYLIRTTYTLLKQNAFKAFLQHPITGLGGGNFESFCGEQKVKGLYPNYLETFDPHSSYMGALSELGLLGFAALMYLVFGIFTTFRQVKKNSLLSEQWFILGLGSVLIFMASEAMVTDIMNFRHYWVFFAVLSIMDTKNRLQFKNINN